MDSQLFVNTSIILALAIGFSFLTQLLRQPLIIAYIMTGIFVGPLFLDIVDSGKDYFEVFAEFGVILLLFLVGLNLDFDYLKKIGKVSILVGLGQVFLTSISGYLLLGIFGLGGRAALFLAIAATFSSTIIITKLLNDKKELASSYGRYVLGLMLAQDLIACALMVFMPSLTSSMSALAPAVLLIAAKSIMLFFLVYFLSKVLMPVILDKVASSGELLLLFTIAWCFSVAGLADWAGISLEVGAIMAGISLGSSVYQLEISSRIRPIRDFFIVIFFVILGSQMKLASISGVLVPGLAMAAFVVLVNPMILYFLFRMGRFTRKNAFLCGLTAGQVSEFGFVVLFLAKQMGFVGDLELGIFTVTALLSISASSYLITYNQKIWLALKPLFDLFGRDRRHSTCEKAHQFDALVIGYHRLGWKICESLSEMGMTYAVIDFDPMAIRKLRERGIAHFYGDVSDPEFVADLPLDTTRLLVSTMPDADNQIYFLRHLRQVNQSCIAIASLSHIRNLEEVYDAGADYVIVPHLLSGQWLSGILRAEQVNRRELKRFREEQRAEMELRFTLGHS